MSVVKLTPDDVEARLQRDALRERLDLRVGDRGEAVGDPHGELRRLDDVLCERESAWISCAKWYCASCRSCASRCPSSSGMIVSSA